MQVLVDELKVRTEKIKLGRSDGRHIDTAVTLNTFITVMLPPPAHSCETALSAFSFRFQY